MAYYLDTSAFLKLVVEERGSAELRDWIDAEQPEFFASDLLGVEALRAARHRGPLTLQLANRSLRAVTLVAVSPAICDAAARLGPANLRSLDAIHLATALAAGDDLDGIITFDARMTQAAEDLGLVVLGAQNWLIAD